MKGVALAVVLLWTTACSYHNVLFNSRQLFRDGEAARWAGRDSVALERYADVVRKTGAALRDRPGDLWSGEALALHGRARLRMGQLAEARAALHDAARTSPSVVDEVGVYLAVIHAEVGDAASAMLALNRALAGSLERESKAEAHLLRGRLLLQQGLIEQGVWDLDRASEAGIGRRVEAGIEGLRWLVTLGEQDAVRYAFDRLLRDPPAGVRSDTIAALALVAAHRWDPGAAATMLDDVSLSRWDRVARGRLMLTRARLLDAAGDTAGARAQVMAVAEGLGSAAADARLTLARWQLDRARDLDAIFTVRTLLLPSARDARAAGYVELIETLESLTSLGYTEPLAFFAAAEVARDQLGARTVARGLFLAYAASAPEEPWAPKALLAALDISPEEGDRAWLRGRLEADPESPYVLAAYGRSSAGYQALEEELDVRLRELTRR